MTQPTPPESTNNNSEKKLELQKNTSPSLPSAAKSRYEKKRSPLHRFWNWTGFGEKKLWDVLQLLIVPTALAIGAFYLQETSKQRDLEIAQANREKDQQIADDRANLETLNRYFDQISTLLFERKLRTAKEKDEVRIVARVRTLTALRQLDGDLKGNLIRFLHEADLIQGKKPPINLTDADLQEINLGRANLSRANLSRANLGIINILRGKPWDRLLFYMYERTYQKTATPPKSVNLSEANLSEANLYGADLQGANLSKADLSGAILDSVNLRSANLRGAIFTPGNLKNALLCDTTMPDGTKSNRNCKDISEKIFKQLRETLKETKYP